MKLGLVAIAAEWEKPYLDEWLDWHVGIGVDEVRIYLNDWDWTPPERHRERVTTVRIDGPRQQMPSYNDAMSVMEDGDCDWVAVIDCDEYIKVRSERNIKQVIHEYKQYPSLAVNWLLHGSNGIRKIEESKLYNYQLSFGYDSDYPSTDPTSPSYTPYGVIGRFRRCAANLDRHVKQIVNLNVYRRYGVTPHFGNPHFLQIPSVNLETETVRGPFNSRNLSKVHELEISHYFCKSWSEFIDRRTKRRADIGIPRQDRLEDLFAAHDRNDMKEEERKI